MEQRAVTTIRTPAALIELKTLVANTQRMAQRAHSLGVSLRPHVKTHKCVEAARYQVAGHFGGITVSIAPVCTCPRPCACTSCPPHPYSNAR